MGKNKILLINPPLRLNYWEKDEILPVSMPTGLLSIAAVLSEKGYEVKIIDGMIDKDYKDSIRENLGGVLFAGISVMTINIPAALDIAELIRKQDPDIPIVWGGVHPTLFPEETLKDSLVDFVCIGEGEYTSLELVEGLKGFRPLSSIKGIGYKENEDFFLTPSREFINLEDLPLLNYESLDLDKYLYRDLGSRSWGTGIAKIMILHSGRGCPYRCSFCFNTHPSQKYRQKSADRLLKELDQVLRKYQPDVIYFQDDNFFAEKDRTLDFFKGIKERGYKFKWLAVTRANYFNSDYLSEKFWETYGKSCLYLGMGIESASTRIRNKILNKALSLNQIEVALKTCNKFKIPLGCSFMTSIPGETLEEMKETVEYIMRIKRLYPLTECSLQYYQPYPGTELYKEVIKRGFIPPKTLREWSEMVNPKEWYGWYIPLEKLTWVENRSMVQYLIWIIPFYTTCLERKSSRMKLFFFFGCFFAKISLHFRLKIDFWCYFIELYIIKLARLLKNWISLK